MKRTMDLTKRKSTEAWADLGYGPSVWLLPGGGQFYTKSCTRCARLLTNALRCPLKTDSERVSEAVRCVHCEEPIDSMILPSPNTRQTANASVRLAKDQSGAWRHGTTSNLALSLPSRPSW